MQPYGTWIENHSTHLIKRVVQAERALNAHQDEAAVAGEILGTAIAKAMARVTPAATRTRVTAVDDEGLVTETITEPLR